jgi:uncharacterized protein YndB with AHSA1/START domain
MQRVERAARLPVPPSQVFAYLSDLGNLPEWMSGVTETRATSEGEMGIGTTAHVNREVMGQRISAPLTITEYEPPTRLAIASEVSGVRVLATLDLAEALDESTDLAFAMEIRGSGLTAFMEPIIAGAAGGDIDESLQRLRGRFGAQRD